MPISLTDQVAVVTGGTRGIGKGISLALARAGCHLVLNYMRDRDAAADTATEVERLGRRALLVEGNVGDPETAANLCRHAADRLGRLDIVVSNAASGILKPLSELQHRHWQMTLNTNSFALVALAQGALPYLEQRGGRIVAISSIGAVRAIPLYGAVGASKAALESSARHLAVELGPKGITVNVVSAGVVETEMLRYFPNRESLVGESTARTPVGRLTTADDVAGAVLFLCSPLAGMVNGHTLVVDGGYSIVG